MISSFIFYVIFWGLFQSFGISRIEVLKTFVFSNEIFLIQEAAGHMDGQELARRSQVWHNWHLWVQPTAVSLVHTRPPEGAGGVCHHLVSQGVRTDNFHGHNSALETQERRVTE